MEVSHIVTYNSKLFAAGKKLNPSQVLQKSFASYINIFVTMTGPLCLDHLETLVRRIVRKDEYHIGHVLDSFILNISYLYIYNAHS